MSKPVTKRPHIDDALLYSIMHIESESGNSLEMQEFIENHCRAAGYKVTVDGLGSLYVTKGTADTYPCAVAHMDTVHTVTGAGIAVVALNGRLTGINPMTMEQTGIGGDDKCGIYAALHCLQHLSACKAAFFVDEEIGCRGSEASDLAFFADCRFILQADRRGNADFVTDISGPLASSRFASAVAPLLVRHGYTPCHGAMSDVMALRDNGIGISVANMSAGYYRPHQSSEYIDIGDLARVCNLMLDICRTCRQVYKFSTPRQPARRGFVADPQKAHILHGLDLTVEDDLDNWPHDPWYKKHPA